MNKTEFDVIVIGAGPAGLSLGHYLNKLKISYTILEKHKAGYSWSIMPEFLYVLSPWWTNLLPGSGPGLTNPFSLVDRDFFYRYLQDYAERNAISIMNDTEVISLSKDGEFFDVVCTEGMFKARSVVCATGYFSNPYTPSLPDGNDGSISEMHAASYLSASIVKSTYPDTKRILIVGKRVTAGQLMVELAESGFDVAISSRSEVITRNSHTFKGKLREFIYYFYEAVMIRFKPDVKYSSYTDMDGGETTKLLKSGKVSQCGNILGVSKGQVILDDEDTKQAFDLIIYATGYKPAFQYLPSVLVDATTGESNVSNMESVELQGLYFLGVDNLVNFRSRYIRGIAKDAKRVARIIAAKTMKAGS